MADVLFTNVRIFDGGGEAPFTGDVLVLPRCGHWTPVERPEDCQRALRDFLASVRS